MNQTICNKCKSIIDKGISLDSYSNINNETNKSYCKISFKLYSKEGALIKESSDYDLCNICYDEFIEFINKPKTHTSNNINYDYVHSINSIPSNDDKCFIVGNHISTKNVEPNSITVGYGLRDIKSVMKCGNVHIFNTKIFTKFEKLMWKLFFGVDIYKADICKYDRK